MHEHSHGAGVHLGPEQKRILDGGLKALAGMAGQYAGPAPMPSERYPTPVAQAVYGQPTDTARSEFHFFMSPLQTPQGHCGSSEPRQLRPEVLLYYPSCKGYDITVLWRFA